MLNANMNGPLLELWTHLVNPREQLFYGWWDLHMTFQQKKILCENFNWCIYYERNAFAKHLAIEHPEEQGDIGHFNIQVHSTYMKPLEREKMGAVKLQTSKADYILNSKSEHKQPLSGSTPSVRDDTQSGLVTRYRGCVTEITRWRAPHEPPVELYVCRRNLWEELSPLSLSNSFSNPFPPNLQNIITPNP